MHIPYNATVLLENMSAVGLENEFKKTFWILWRCSWCEVQL